MSLGFVIRYSATTPNTQPPAPQFSVKGARSQRTCALHSGVLESTVIGQVEDHEDNLFFCGHVANWIEVAQRLASRGLSRKGLASQIHCIKLIYQIYGVPGLRMLDGLFVGVFVDKGNLVAFASKTPGPSIYFRVNNDTGTVCISTELKALPAHERRLRSFADIIDKRDAQQSAQTCMHEVLRVRQGHCIEISLHPPQITAIDTEYYSTCRAITLFEEATVIEKLRDTLAQSVSSLPGRTAHCLVSGGLDSSIVGYFAQQRFDTLNLFSLGTEKNNEFDNAEAFGSSIGLPVSRILVKDNQFIGALPEVVALTEHCFSTFVEYLIPVHLAHQKINDSADIMLSGYGSDVLFAGFAKPANTLRQVTELVESEYASTAWANEASQCLCSGVGMEIGYPFFDSRVVDLAFSIDPYLKHKHGVEKYILREAFRGILNDTVIARRKVGIHEGTGCEDYLTNQVAQRSAEKARLVKDAMCYRILQQVLIDGLAPYDVAMDTLHADALNIARDPAHADALL